MSTVAALPGLSIAEAGEGGSNRRPLPLHPIPGSLTSIQGESTASCRLYSLDLRLTPYWNETALSGSSRIGIKSRFQAHLWIGKC
jgi:hypothetical protein